jgi:molybdenum cofactor cytidylyltransferase
MTIAAVVLAAGEGTRFGGDTPKLLADLAGKPLVRRVVDHALAAGCDDTYVVVGGTDLADVLPDEVTIVENHSWALGQALSLRAAVAAAEADGHTEIVVGLGDQALISAEAWRAVAEAEGVIVTATFGGHRSPPVKLTEQVWPLLPLEGDEGARSLLRSRPELVTEISCQGSAVDVDTLADLERVRRAWRNA